MAESEEARPRRQEYNRDYHEAHRAEIRERKRKYYAANREKMRLRDRKYREANREKKREYDHKRYDENRDEMLRRQRKRVQANRLKLDRYRRAIGCIHCGTDQGRLAFHHLDPATKSFNMSDYGRRTWAALMTEAEKCTVLCDSCHGKLHAKPEWGGRDE